LYTHAQNLLPECIFSTLQTVLKIEQKFKITKNCHYLKNGWKYRKILKILVGILQRIIIGFKLYRVKYFLFKIERYL